MVDCAVAEHPPAPDAVTVYVVVDEGVTVIDFVVAPPGLHNQPLAVPPFSVSVTVAQRPLRPGGAVQQAGDVGARSACAISMAAAGSAAHLGLLRVHPARRVHG